MNEPSEKEEQEKYYPIQQKATFGAGAFTAAELFLAHLGPTGMFLGAVAGYIGYRHGAEAYEWATAQWREAFPGSAPDATSEKPGKQGRSFLDRAIGRFPESREEVKDEATSVEAESVDSLDLGPALKPHADSIFSQRLTILGQPGSGKSNTVADLAEEIAQFDAPLIIFDLKPEYGRLCEQPYFTNPFKANASNVTPRDAHAFGQRIMSERLQVVLDLHSYHDDDLAALVMIDLLNGIGQWEEARSNEQRIPVTCFLDEAHYWLPQQASLSTVEKAVFVRLQQTFFALVTGGRSFGMGCVIATQRPANVDKRVIALSDWYLLLRATYPNDLKIYNDLGVDSDVAMALAPGEAFVLGPEHKGVFQLRRRYSPDEAKTPGLSALQRPVLREQQAAYQYAPVQRPMRPDYEPTHTANDARTTASGEPNLTLVARDVEPSECAHDNAMRPVSEPTHRTQEDDYPKLNATQITVFANAYEMSGNIDKSLGFAKADSRYRQHARVIIRDLGLKKEG